MDRVRVRVRAPSPTPHVSVTGGNQASLGDLEALLRAIDAARPGLAGADAAARASALRGGELGPAVVDPLVATLGALDFEPGEVDAFLAMLQRGFDALTDAGITSIEVSLS